MKNLKLTPYVFCVEKNNIWFLHTQMAILFCYHVEENSLEIKGILPVERAFSSRKHYVKMHKHGEKVIFVPSWEKSILVFYSDINVFKKIALLQADESVKHFFQNTLVCNNILYCIPDEYPWLIAFDMETLSVEYVTNLKDEIYAAMPVGQFGIISDISDNFVWGVVWESNLVFKYNIHKAKLDFCEGIKSDGIYCGISVEDDKVFLYDGKTSCIDCYAVDEKMMATYICSIVLPSKRWNLKKIAPRLFLLASAHDDEYILINDALNFVYRHPVSVHYPAKLTCTMGAASMGENDEIIYYSAVDDEYIKMYSNDKKFVIKNYVCDAASVREIEAYILKTYQYREMPETESYELVMYMKSLTSIKGKKKERASDIKSFGRHIYENIVFNG